MKLKFFPFAALLTIFAVVLGIYLGLSFPNGMNLFSFVGSLFIQTLLIVTYLFLFTVVFSGVTQIGNSRKVRHILTKSGLYFLAVGVACSILGIALVSILEPGHSISAKFSDIHNTWDLELPVGFSPYLYGSILISSLLFGIASVSLGSKAKNLTSFFNIASHALNKVISALLFFAPIGFLSLSAGYVAVNEKAQLVISSMFNLNDSPWNSIITSSSYFLTVIAISLIIFSAVIFPLIWSLIGKKKISDYYKTILPAWACSLGSSSSAVALPFTYQGLIQDNNVSTEKVTSNILPVSTILNSGITAFIISSTVIFLCQAAGEEISFLQYILISVVPVFFSIGLVGMPFAVSGTLLVLLPAFGFSNTVLSALVMFLSIEWIIDRIRAMTNVSSDYAAIAVLSQLFEFKTAKAMPVKKRERAPSPSRKVSTRSGTRTNETKERKVRTVSERAKRQPTYSKSEVKNDKTKVTYSKTKESASAQSKSPFEITESEQPKLDIDQSNSKYSESGKLKIKSQKTNEAEEKGKPKELTSENDSSKSKPEVQKTRKTTVKKKSVQSVKLKEKETNGKKDKKDNSVEKDNGKSNSHISPDIIAQELQIVARQLKSEKEENITIKNEEISENKDDSVTVEQGNILNNKSSLVVTLPTAVDNASSEESESIVEDVEDKVEKDIFNDNVNDTDDFPDEPVTEKEVEIQKPKQYGRGRSKKNKTEETEQKETVSVPKANDTEEDGYSLEEISSFGRSNKRKAKS